MENPPKSPNIPPDDIVMEENATQSHSYKEILLDKQNTAQANYFAAELQSTLTQQQGKETIGPIILSQEDKNRLYEPWRFSIIIKLFGKKMPHYLLRSKLVDLWNPSEQLILIDLGWDFFIVKFGKEENLVKAIQKGLWFISGNFLSVRRWEHKFVPQEATLSFTAIWVRLPQLPTEFYDKEVLEKVGRKLGKLLKVDTCTSATLRGRYARICIGENVLCTGCGRIGHILKGCMHRQKQRQPQMQESPECSNTKQSDVLGHTPNNEQEEERKVVSFPRKRKKEYSTKQNEATDKKRKDTQSTKPEGNKVKMFDATSGKFLGTQTFRYTNKSNTLQEMDRIQPTTSKGQQIGQ
ncbi:PREDICTED: uncharacterized protein LOC109218299 [Nicotiana attenuata]|uniref:uncharacterized protein LOC109218299 n=1 Tax=Nicotiana attenuata TaxID=49451 RepID=UPI000904C5BC|nr:PREDICTED: uncharacterized protein LOC109218299 [Nicotiana attenuata]